MPKPHTGVEGFPPLQDVERIFNELRNFCTLYGHGVSKEYDTQVSGFVGSFQKGGEYYRYFQYLGVSVAGFLYMDPSDRKVHYLFFSDATGNKSQHVKYMIGYQEYGWQSDDATSVCTKENAQQNSRIIDTLFLIHRHLERDFLSLASTSFMPEYILDLPMVEINNQPEKIKERFNFTADLDGQIRNQFGLHYVPYGEMIAFMLMWRRLLRRKGGGQISWEWLEWQTGESSPEKLLSALLSGIEDVDGPNLDRDLYQQNIKPALKGIGNQDKGSSWDQDLADLLLTDSKDAGRKTDALQSLEIYLGKDSRFEELAKQRVAATVDDVLWVPTEEFVDQMLAALCPEWHQKATADLTAPLLDLHKASRFPILPYYYWSRISKRPRCHSAMPVWASLKAPLSDPIKTPIVGIAVIDIAPLEQLDPTYRPAKSVRYSGNGADGKPIVVQEESRLRYIHSSLRIIAQLQVDAFYYNYVQENRIRASESKNISMYMSHDSKNLISPLMGILSQCEEGVNHLDIIKEAERFTVETMARLSRTAQFSTSLNQNSNSIGRSYNNCTLIPMKQLLLEELAGVILCCQTRDRRILGKILEVSISASDGNSMSIMKRSEKLAERILEFCGLESVKVIDKIGQYTSIYNTGLRIMFREIFQNVMNHEIIPVLDSLDAGDCVFGIKINATTGDKIVSSDEGSMSRLEVYEYAIEIVLPGIPKIPILDRWSGLQSLKSAADKIGIYIKEKELLIKVAEDIKGISLPFWHVKGDGKHGWVVSKIALGREGQ